MLPQFYGNMNATKRYKRFTNFLKFISVINLSLLFLVKLNDVISIIEIVNIPIKYSQKMCTLLQSQSKIYDISTK